jgi:membrane protease YdiL (CAAX protease family)
MDHREPWNPDRAWADPFIATLALLVVLAVGSLHRAGRGAPAPAAPGAGLQGRVLDISLGGARFLAAGPGPRKGIAGEVRGWDGAVAAVYAAEGGDKDRALALVKDLPGPEGATFRGVLAYAYGGSGAPPSPADTDRCARALGGGGAAGLLQARLARRAGADPKPFEDRARDWVLPRFLGLMAAGLGGMALFLGGLAYLLVLALSHKPAAPTPRFRMAGRAVLIVLLGWFVTHLASALILGLVVRGLPFLRPFHLPLTYAFHAVLGTAYLCLAEGLSLGELAARVAPGPKGRALLAGACWFAVAFTLVATIAIALGPLLKSQEPPQRELMELIARTRGPLALAATFLTVAVLAPTFEELLFRGFLLPWLSERFQERLSPGRARMLAVLVTAAAFGAMHLQPMALPTLCTLGAVLGFAFLRTGNLLTAILVHGLWNGGIFVALKLLA